jgi:hypothetical protein
MDWVPLPGLLVVALIGGIGLYWRQRDPSMLSVNEAPRRRHAGHGPDMEPGYKVTTENKGPR